MSLITVINDVCDALDFDGFESVIGADEPAANTMVELAQEAGDEISRRVDWRATLTTFTVPASGSPFPNDYQRLIPGGSVRAADGTFIRPVTNSAQWAFLTQYPSAQPFYFLQGATILMAPASAGVGAVMDYVSANWIKGVTGNKATYSADDDTALFPERLLVKNIIWRWRRLKGLSFNDHLTEFEADLVQEINADRGVS